MNLAGYRPRDPRCRAAAARPFLLALACMLPALACSGLDPAGPADGGPSPADAEIIAPADAGCTAPGCEAGVDAGRADAGPADAEVFKVEIHSVIPSRGPLAGGTSVTIEGVGFYRGFATGSTAAMRDSRLLFGAREATDFQIIDDGKLEATAPPGSVGALDVILENPNGTARCADCFTYFVDLSLASISPASGPLSGGFEIALTGQGFSPATMVLVGGRASPRVEWVDSRTVRALIPPGAAAGPADVRVFDRNGVADLRRGLTYVAALALTRVEPAHGSAAGGTRVLLHGAGFEEVRKVGFGGEAAPFTLRDGATLEVTAPAGVPGPVAVTVTGVQDEAILPAGYVYFDDAPGVFAVAGVSPAHGPREGGNRVLIVGTGLSAASVVTFGGAPARMISAAGEHALEVEPPAGTAGTRVDVAVQGEAAPVTLEAAYRYDLALDGVEPSSGSSAGGEQVTLRGEGFPSTLEVAFGGLPATEVVILDARTATARTPPGAGPSEVMVRDGTDPTNTDELAAGFDYLEPLRLGLVTPGTGAIAGGTSVTVLGAGFAPGTGVWVGGAPLKDLRWVDRGTITGRTPPGIVGVAEVKVGRGDVQDLAPEGFSYFDPRNAGGGSSGGPLNGTLNVTVLESNGEPIPGATVLLGGDPTTTLQGRTDRRGQLTLSDPRLVKAQQVNVSKDGYQTLSIERQQSQNLTVFLWRTGGVGVSGPPYMPGGGSSSSPAIVSGRVTGFKLPRPLRSGERAVAEVWFTTSSVYGSPPLGWRTEAATRDARGERWRVTEDGGSYSVFTGKGLRALYAVFGIHELHSGRFTPVLMGIRRNVNADPDKPALGQDIVLDMHLDAVFPVTILNPQWDPLLRKTARNEVYAWLDLGGQGLVPLGSSGDNSDRLELRAMPRLDGESFIFLNRIAGDDNPPQSYSFRRQFGDLTQGLTIGPMLDYIRLAMPGSGERFDGRFAWSSGAGPVPDLTQLSVSLASRAGWSSLWTVIMPGSQTTATMPRQLTDALLATSEPGDRLFVDLTAVRSPRFEYDYWTYGQLSLDAWTSWTQAGGSIDLVSPEDATQ